ncbi:unnamed protein product [Arctogadus glacialis]
MSDKRKQLQGIARSISQAQEGLHGRERHLKEMNDEQEGLEEGLESGQMATGYCEADGDDCVSQRSYDTTRSGRPTRCNGASPSGRVKEAESELRVLVLGESRCPLALDRDHRVKIGRRRVTLRQRERVLGGVLRGPVPQGGAARGLQIAAY